MVRVFDQKVVVCEIIMVLENNGVPLYALDDVLAKVKEGAEMTPVMVAPPGLPVEVSEQHKNEVMEEYNRRKCAYALAGDGDRDGRGTAHPSPRAPRPRPSGRSSTSACPVRRSNCARPPARSVDGYVPTQQQDGWEAPARVKNGEKQSKIRGF